MTGPIPLVLGLGVHPPSNGAHALAWWLGADDGRWERLWRALNVPAGNLERLLAGEVAPCDDCPELAEAVAAATGGAVPAEGWFHGCALDWADRPHSGAPPGQRAA